MTEYEIERKRQEESAANFKVELSELLKKYGVIITANDYWEGYSECGRDIQIHFEFYGICNIELEYSDSVSARDLTN